MHRFLFLFFFVFLCGYSSGDVYGQSTQKANLANEYFNTGEYEKANELYLSLYNENKNNYFYFGRYVQCLIEINELTLAEKVVKDEIKKTPEQLPLYISLGNIYERGGQKEKADKEYEKTIEKLSPDQNLIAQIANSFSQLNKLDLAIATYLKGENLIKIKNLYTYNLAELYRRKGDIPNMITFNLKYLNNDIQRLNTVQSNMQRYLQTDDYKELQSQLYELIQKEPNDITYPEMLQWTFITIKDYNKALRQAKALDRQFEENGVRVFNVAYIAFNDEDYDSAIDGFGYIANNHPKNSSYYIESRRGLLNAKKAKVISKYDYTTTDLQSLQAEYLDFFTIMGKNTQTAGLMLEYAEFEALYMNNLPLAIETLEELRQFGGISKEAVAQAKLNLADYYLMSGDRWEASLLFSQVDKDFKEGTLGEYARYKNAKLSYYAGDFEWAQEQFKILKGATSKLISNDAIDMSVFIMDNLGLDTTETTLQMFAKADLLIFQNKHTEAIDIMDSIKILFPEHSLEDDIIYLKAQIYKKQKKTDLAVNLLENLVEKFPEEIKADDALFELAELYEEAIQDKEKAKQLYEKIFTDYSGSTYAVEAKKRYRILRGENL
ncbi:MAG: tetratricopeptide repeat protein [Saprospiraceae bacterium]|nr:tetratricopeptide repeat protein [Saprospiraceae bacterium]